MVYSNAAKAGNSYHHKLTVLLYFSDRLGIFNITVDGLSEVVAVVSDVNGCTCGVSVVTTLTSSPLNRCSSCCASRDVMTVLSVE